MRVGLLAFAACGRIAFDPVGGGDGGGSSGDSGRTIDGATDRANLVFVSNSSLDGAMGGVAGADARCNLEAMQAGKPGTFVAWLSSSTVAAKSRLVGSRGWVRADGAPVADTVDQLVAGEIYNPIDVTAAGGPVISGSVWTATAATGDALAASCADWTNNTVGMTAVFGALDRSWPRTTNDGTGTCNGVERIYCFEIGHAFPVHPMPSGLPIGFVSTVVTNLGVTGLDGECQNEAQAAGLTGTFTAAVATQTSSIASRYATSSGWARVDGTPIAANAADMFSNNDLLTFVNQDAAGAYLTSTLATMRTGAATPQVAGSNSGTCSNWTANTGQGSVLGDPTSRLASVFWSGSTATCVTGERVLCLQN